MQPHTGPSSIAVNQTGIGAKIREAQMDKIPYMLVIGDKEQTSGTVAVRERSAGDQGALAVADFIARVEREVRERTMPIAK